MPKLESRPDLLPAVKHFQECFRLSRAHNSLVRNALECYGDHGPQISGIMRDHFPDWVKRRLRKLCNQMNAAADAGMRARPRGVHRSTMLKLYREVRAQVGSGFYY
jgi:hypothetical protein